MASDLRQEVGELVEQIDNTVLTKQTGVVNYGELNAAIDLRCVKHDVELRFGGRRPEFNCLAASELQHTLRRVSHIEHDLKQGIMVKISLWIDFFDHSFKRQIVVCVRVQANFSDSPQ